MKVPKKIMTLLFAFAICFTGICFASEDNLDTRYTNYKATTKNNAYGKDTIILEGEAYNHLIGDGKVVADKMLSGGKGLFTEVNAQAIWTFEVKDEGLYNLSVDYLTKFNNTGGAMRSIYMDDIVLFRELLSVPFSCIWQDELVNGRFEKDAYKNELRPNSNMKTELSTEIPSDFARSPFDIYLTKGTHKLSFIGVKGDLTLDKITVKAIEKVKNYSEIKKEYEKSNLELANATPIKNEAEIVYQKSNFTIYPIYDRSSAATTPTGTGEIVLNTIGREKWQTPGQWISWEVKAPTDGLYNISLRFRQSILSGTFVSRRLKIDGVVPFSEMESIKFNYSSDWQMNMLSDKNEAYSFYLTKGKHIITLEVTRGDMAKSIDTAGDILSILNQIYKEILIITGSNPDIYRDYEFDKNMPETIKNMKAQANRLKELSKEVLSIGGKKGEGTAILDKLVYQLTQMAKKPESIASQFNLFKSNIGALGAYIFTVSNQPLELDYLLVTGENYKLQKANSGFFEDFLFNFKVFVFSFTKQYKADDSKSKNAIEVWVPTGRDQAQIIRSMSESDFTKKTGTAVNVKLVTATTLLPSTLAGRGPDIAMSVPASDPVNYAIRDAVINLKDFADYNKVSKRFVSEAFTSFSYENAIYALPENLSYPMMFYRKDIFSQLDLPIPKTWDEWSNLIPVIKRHNMEVGLLPVNSLLFTFMFQNGTPIYKNNSTQTNLDSDDAMAAFKRVCDMYILYKLPVAYDFANRFRTGEMPIAITDRSAYNQLVVFAPEINGLWEMVPIPGIKTSSGEIKNTAPLAVTGVMILKSSKNKASAWEYLKWWTDKDAQTTFGLEMESILGPAAKYPTANTEALAMLPWSITEFKSLNEQQKNLMGVPMIPGNYILDRSITFAFNSSYNDGENPVESLESMIVDINKELERKRWEFISH